jgi:hypothetical protein
MPTQIKKKKLKKKKKNLSFSSLFLPAICFLLSGYFFSFGVLEVFSFIQV